MVEYVKKINPLNDNNNKALRGERYIVDALTKHGFEPEWLAVGNRMSAADIRISSGKLIDVKYAEPKESTPYWTFNFHHHGKKQQGIDFFICILVRPEAENLIYVFPANVLKKRKTLAMSVKSIRLGRYEYFLENWDLLK